MWEKELLTNVTDGLAYLDSIDDGDNAFNFAQIEDMQHRYPLTMYPLYRLQVRFILFYSIFCLHLELAWLCSRLGMQHGGLITLPIIISIFCSSSLPQTCIIQHTLGEYFWENHKAKLIDHRTETLLEQEKALKLRRKMEVKSKELVNEEMLKQRMGYKYYLFPWQRGTEKARMMRIAVLEQELDKTYSTKHIRTELKV